MADDVNVPAELQSRFADTFGRIVSLTESLRTRVDQINQANVDAGGRDDATAQAYHSQVDKPTSDISTLVADISTLFGLTGTNGEEAARTLTRGDEEAAETARSWDVSGDQPA
jgi:hypothetical protein